MEKCIKANSDNMLIHRQESALVVMALAQADVEPNVVMDVDHLVKILVLKRVVVVPVLQVAN